MLEVLTAGIIGTLMALPILTLLFTSTRESMVSEDYMFAEALAHRHLAEALAQPLDGLDERLPIETAFKGLPAEDAVLGKVFPEYARNLEGDLAFTGTLTVSRVEAGLYCYEVALEWPTGPGSSARRRYALIRFRSRYDIALTSNHRLTRPMAPSGGATP
jgi:hypothetical protein